MELPGRGIGHTEHRHIDLAIARRSHAHLHREVRGPAQHPEVSGALQIGLAGASWAALPAAHGVTKQEPAHQDVVGRVHKVGAPTLGDQVQDAHGHGG